MDCMTDGNRVRTTGAYDSRILRVLNKLEGMKKWGANRSFSFENTPYNLEAWFSVFPQAVVTGVTRPRAGLVAVAGGEVAPRPARPAFEYKTPPRAHQSAALAKLAGKPACALFMDVGTGKSWTAIAMMGARWCSGESDHVLLVAKNGVHQQWIEEQIPAHMSAVVPWRAWGWKKGKPAQRRYEEMTRFNGLKIFSINIDALGTANGEERILHFLGLADGRATMIVDESQDIKSWNSIRTRRSIKFGSLCKYRMIMTGTPIAKDLTDMFSQMNFLDEGIVGHRYITTFKRQYCEYEQTDYGPKLIGHKNVEHFYEKIEPYVFRVTSEEALDLPPKVFDERAFKLHKEQRAAMQELRENFLVEFGKDERAYVKNAAGLLTRLQQISCGYLPLEYGSIRRFPNPRLDELLNVLDQTRGKVIIWCRFNEDVEIVSAALGARAVKFYGKTKEDDRQKNKSDFLRKNSSVDRLVASPEAAGTGLNLQGECRVNVYYSNSFNALARWQSEGRTWRDGTTGSREQYALTISLRNGPMRQILIQHGQRSR